MDYSSTALTIIHVVKMQLTEFSYTYSCVKFPFKETQYPITKPATCSGESIFGIPLLWIGSSFLPCRPSKNRPRTHLVGFSYSLPSPSPVGIEKVDTSISIFYNKREFLFAYGLSNYRRFNIHLEVI